MVNRRQNVDPPAFTPTAYGLMSAVNMPDTGDAHWMNGITYQSRCLTSADTWYDPCIAVTGTGPPPPAPAKAANTGGLVTRGATPFTVFAEFDCSPVGLPDAQKIANDALAQSAPFEVEYAFWTGKAGSTPQSVVWPHLQSNAQQLDSDGIILQTAATVVSGASASVRVGLGLLEEAIGTCSNGLGVIHVQRKVLATLFYLQLVEARAGKLYTKSGNLVAAGAGYPGTGPAGQAITPTTSWMYATGPIDMRSSAVTYFNPTQSFDRTTNTMKMIAERTYLLDWDCCHAAVLADIGTA